RQARRFVDYLLTENSPAVEALARDMLELKRQANQCTSCYRFFIKSNGAAELVCNTCTNKNRDHSLLMVVEKDKDLEVVERSGYYGGLFFVLGGLLPILEESPAEKIRSRELVRRLEESESKVKVKEVIIALSANNEGDNTSDYLNQLLTPFKATGLKVTVLGRGLSTGTELEYSDEETIKNALKNRA
ncbi:MAG: toprim domain-containing protein, partial [Patescibacteria group bacterium]